jgi:hypothetical protein
MVFASECPQRTDERFWQAEERKAESVWPLSLLRSKSIANQLFAGEKILFFSAKAKEKVGVYRD